MVHVLVATTEGQGASSDDFACAVEGELVFIPADTCRDPACGCDRAFAGMASHKGVTTALVVARDDLTLADLHGALRDSLERQGWLSPYDTNLDQAVFAELAERLSVAADFFPPGSVLERSGDNIRCRLRTEPLPAPFGPVDVLDEPEPPWWGPPPWG